MIISYICFLILNKRNIYYIFIIIPRNEGSLKLILVATQYPSFPEMSMAQKLLSHELVETDGAKAIVENVTMRPSNSD